VLGSQRLDDGGARRDDVADGRAPDPALVLGDEVRGKAVGERRKRPIEDDPHHLPVAGHRVLARGRLRHASVRRERVLHRLDAAERHEAWQTE
jgi:hypothetical protein